MSEMKHSEAIEYVDSCFNEPFDFIRLQNSLKYLEGNVKSNIDDAELLGEIYGFLESTRNLEKSYFYYQIYLSQQGYSIGWNNKGDSSLYLGAIGDFRNESQVSCAMDTLGTKKCKEIDLIVIAWLEENKLSYLLVQNE